MMNTTLIGEVGINHNGDIDIAKKLIDIASIAGFNNVKFQKRNPDICVPEHQKNKMKHTPWGEMTYLEYKKRIEFNFDQYHELFSYANDKGLIPFASVWDIDSARFMKKLTNIVKIPSALITDKELLNFCNKEFGVKMMSTGMSTEEEIVEAIKIFEPHIIFHTNSCYPSPINELNLNYIKHLINNYPNKIIGYSSHEYDVQPTIWAVATGAKIIEKHITIDQNMWGSDQKSSLGPIGMFKLVREVKRFEQAIGEKGPRSVFQSEIEKRDSLRK